ncbi:MAG: DUF4097 family beta strand repeat-containing protein [Terriglobales bacterium]
MAAGLGAWLAVAAVPLAAQNRGPEITRTVAGSIPVRGPMQLHIAAELGNVRVSGARGNELTYTILLRTRAAADASAGLDAWPVSVRQEGDTILIATGRGPAEGHTQVQILVTAPPQVRAIQLHSAVGNLSASHLAGSLRAVTAAGNIAVDEVSGPVRVETAGGNISLGHLGGSIHASTAGGDITLAAAAGSVDLQSQGGNISVGEAAGPLRIATAGGAIVVGRAGGDVVAETAGGNIRLGPVAGTVRAESGGGNIRVAAARGLRCQTGAGDLDLGDVRGPVRAVTGAGSIHAVITAAAGEFAASLLQSSSGDIVVYLPRRLPVTVDAATTGGQQLSSDIPQIASAAARNQGASAQVSLNGGGPVLRIETSNGGIRIQQITSR